MAMEDAPLSRVELLRPFRNILCLSMAYLLTGILPLFQKGINEQKKKRRQSQSADAFIII
jgi:hypothetical protein